MTPKSDLNELHDFIPGCNPEELVLVERYPDDDHEYDRTFASQQTWKSLMRYWTKLASIRIKGNISSEILPKLLSQITPPRRPRRIILDLEGRLQFISLFVHPLGPRPEPSVFVDWFGCPGTVSTLVN